MKFVLRGLMDFLYDFPDTSCDYIIYLVVDVSIMGLIPIGHPLALETTSRVMVGGQACLADKSIISYFFISFHIISYITSYRFISFHIISYHFMPVSMTLIIKPIQCLCDDLTLPTEAADRFRRSFCGL